MSTPYTLKLEAIGDNIVHHKRMCLKHDPRLWRPRRLIEWRAQSPWVARLTGWTPLRGFARQFVRGQKDYTEANSCGSRGIFVYFHLDDGLYEVNEIPGWGQVRRYCLRIAGGLGTEIPVAEAVACLRNGA